MCVKCSKSIVICIHDLCYVQNDSSMIGIASKKVEKEWFDLWSILLYYSAIVHFSLTMVLFIKEAQKRLWHLGLMNCCVVMSLTLYYLEYFAELHDDDLDRLLNHNRMGSRRRRRPILTIFWAVAEEVVAVGNSYSYFDKEQLLDNSNFVVVICDCCML